MPKVLIFTFLFYLISPCSSLATTLSQSRPVTVSASIGQLQVTIYGYTAPLSRVELVSPRVFAVTYSNQAGYYKFDRALLPNQTSDLCLTSIDDSNLRTIPTCIPPPVHNLTNIGPILLAPTIALDSNQLKPHSTTTASGQTIPNSELQIYLFQDSSSAPLFPRQISALSLPKFSIRSNSQGHYNFTLPTNYSSLYRLYSSSLLGDQTSPKSNTLSYSLPPVWYLFWLQHRWLIISLPLYLLTLTIFFYLLSLNRRPLSRYLPSNRLFLPALKP